MDKRQFLIGIIFASIFGGMVAVGGFVLFMPEQEVKIIQAEPQPVRLSNNLEFDTSKSIVPEGMNFVAAAKVTTPGVVHISSTFDQTSSRQSSPFDDYFREFFDQRGQAQPQMGTGSGVIISEDGYIVTNNHVIENASEIEVQLNNNSTYKAEVIGTHPNTDLALIKIEADDLPVVKIGNSDDVQIGEWVLAVGNPFDFRSTVTAGIVSAKGRNIDILARRRTTPLNYTIESFIQTDAAVNPGNSGGALVNLRGELVGVNTAIATPTGTYAGYSFAVPANLVRKVVDDLKEFGVVQRGVLGVSIGDVDADVAEDENLDVLEGVLIRDFAIDGSGAKEAGMKVGDVIIAVDGKDVKKTSELQEKIGLRSPGDQVDITFIRDGRERTVAVTLTNRSGNMKVVTKESLSSTSIAGATFEDLSKDELEEFELEGGAKIVDLNDGRWKDAGIKEGFVVTKLDKRPVRNVEELSAYLRRAEGSALIEGYYQPGDKVIYGIGW